MVGAWMDFDDVQVRSDVTLEVVLLIFAASANCRRRPTQLFVVDRDERLQDVLPLKRLIVSEPEQLVADVMQPQVARIADLVDGCRRASPDAACERAL